MRYVGRFAPTPSGPLHFGSLVTALASWLEARHQGGQWRVRIEDLDPPREEPGAATRILQTLEAFALTWDDPVIYQSQRTAAYAAALETLKQKERAYPCSCTRKELAGYRVYPGCCRLQPRHPERPLAWRFVVDKQQPACWQDGIQGTKKEALADYGDPIIRRKDGLWAYQLAVVVDDIAQGITEVVRGTDLLDSTPWQLQLHQALAPASAPLHYTHLPVIIQANGQKLSKQNHAPPLALERPSALLYDALVALNQPVAASWVEAPPEQLLQQALAHWQLSRVPAVVALKAPFSLSTPFHKET